MPGAKGITIRMLLAHRSGLPDYQGLSFDEIYYPSRIRPTYGRARRSWGHRPRRRHTPAGLVPLLANGLHRPGRGGAQGFAYDSAANEFVSIFPPDGSVPTFTWGAVWTDGGLMCTAQDAARFTHALLGGGLVSPDALASMVSFGREGYGLGVASKTDGAHPLQGHAGTKPGYDAAAWYDPERRLTIVALTNGVGPNFLAGTVFQRMDEAYARGATP